MVHRIRNGHAPIARILLPLQADLPPKVSFSYALLNLAKQKFLASLASLREIQMHPGTIEIPLGFSKRVAGGQRGIKGKARFGEEILGMMGSVSCSSVISDGVRFSRPHHFAVLSAMDGQTEADGTDSFGTCLPAISSHLEGSKDMDAIALLLSLRLRI